MTRIEEAAAVMKIFQRTLAMELMKALARTRRRRRMTGSSRTSSEQLDIISFQEGQLVNGYNYRYFKKLTQFSFLQ
jgi:hypothetical protein